LPYAPSCNLLIGSQSFAALDGWDETLPYCEDVDLSWRAQLAGMTLAFAADAVVHYRYRSSLRESFTQMRRYKAAEVALYARYRRAGAQRAGVGEALGRLWWLTSRSPYIGLGLERRMLWWSIAGAEAGRVRGSWQCRTLYL
jgi:GT2 family glycosyltransferase